MDWDSLSKPFYVAWDSSSRAFLFSVRPVHYLKTNTSRNTASIKDIVSPLLAVTAINLAMLSFFAAIYKLDFSPQENLFSIVVTNVIVATWNLMTSLLVVLACTSELRPFRVYAWEIAQGLNASLVLLLIVNAIPFFLFFPFVPDVRNQHLEICDLLMRRWDQTSCAISNQRLAVLAQSSPLMHTMSLVSALLTLGFLLIALVSLSISKIIFLSSYYGISKRRIISRTILWFVFVPLGTINLVLRRLAKHKDL